MYRKERERQISFTDFNQPLGMKMNPENRWVKKAELIPWDDIEDKYAELFPSNTGMPAKPLRMALGSLLIQKQLKFPDEELVEEIRENPYFQYFIGLPGYEDKIPFVPSLLVEFRKRITPEILAEINEMIIEQNINNSDDDNNSGNNSNGKHYENTTKDKAQHDNEGTLIIDATCAPQNIKFPQDINLLNEAREKLEKIISRICCECNFYKPRMYRKNARRDYLAIAKCRKRSAKKLRTAIRKQLQYVKRDIGYVYNLLANSQVKLKNKEKETLETIIAVYEQQLYMYQNKTHTVANRIVSISQPYIRPIVRGKAKSPVEFGAKLDLSVDENGMSRLEKLSFDAYNESGVLISALENYKKRTGHYPERALADQIYRTRENIKYCTTRGIRLSGKKLGRPKNENTLSNDCKKVEHADNTDRIEVERKFSLAKRKFGLGLVLTKLEDTTRTSIMLSVLAMNIDRLAALFLRLFLPLRLSFSMLSVSGCY